MVDHDAAIERVGARAFGEVDVGESNGTKACVVGVSAAIVAVVVQFVGTH